VTGPPRERLKPARAGIINLWDYFDEEFAFADGRLALRGHNGSGKTKALEVLFPFIIDGSLDARRLDPFSGENRTMKANLLYRGQESEYGYVWMEFGGPLAPDDETVTLIIGLRAHRNWDRPRPSFFITGKRMGIDFGLLSAESRPLTAVQLTAILGRDAYFGDKKGSYQDAVDARLFGLGRERYTQLLDLLIALRRPLLAKDLDPVKVSETLTAGLSPVDENLVEQAARDFENLAAVQKQYDDLAAADQAVGEFLAQYTGYLRVHARHQLDQVRSRIAAVAAQAGAIRAASAQAAGAGQAEAAASAAAELAGQHADQLTARIGVLQNLDAYKDFEKLAMRRDQAAREERELAAGQARLTGARADVAELDAEAASIAERHAELSRAAERHRGQLVAAAASAGISRAGEPADTGADLAVTARARLAARRDDIRAVRAQLGGVRDAERDRAAAEAALGTAATQASDREQAAAGAGRTLAAARAELAAGQAGWAARWTGAEPYAALTAAEAGQLASALDQAGEPGAASLAEVFSAVTQERRAGLITTAERLRNRAESLAAAEAELAAERAAVADQRDEAPPPSDLRPADRSGRPGAPLWRLVRFAAAVSAGQAAAIEGALYGAGLLTAWVHPDPAQTFAALAAGEADGYLVAPPSGRPDGRPLPAGQQRPAGQRTLADVLVPEQQDLVPAEIITAVLGSITLAADLRPDTAGPVVTAAAQYSYGPHAGARPKTAAEYIGAASRAARRAARLAALDAAVADAARRRGAVTAERAAADDALAGFGQAQLELPSAAAVTAAVGAVAEAAILLAAARGRLDEMKAVLDAAVAELDARTRRLRRVAAERELAVSGDGVDAVERAAADFERAVADLSRARADITAVAADLGVRRDRIARLSAHNDEAAQLLAARQAEHLAVAAALATEEAASKPEYRQLRDDLAAAEKDLIAAQAQRGAARRQASAEHDRLVAARADFGHGSSAMTAAVTELLAQAATFEPYAHATLRPLLGVTAAAPWTDSAQWPGAAALTAALIGQLTGGGAPGGPGGLADPAAAIAAALPAGTGEVLAAFSAAVQGGRAVTEGGLKNAVDRMWSAYRDFENALKAGEDGYQADMTGDAPFTVDVATSGGRFPVSAFAAAITEEVENQRVLLAERERTVLEDSLLSALAQQIHSRVIAAKDLVAEMDADTRSKPMSSGTSVGIRWVRADSLTERAAAVSQLLDRDAASLGPEGLAQIRGLLRAMIHEHRARYPRDTYREALASVLDYRAWHAFELRMFQPGQPAERLTRRKHSQMSGGEKSAAIHLPLFAAANALYSSSKPSCPRLIALDEAFAGIDDRFKPELLGLTVQFDLDLFMTGHDLWVTSPAVPMIAHYDMQHDKGAHAVSALLVLWDGGQLVDAGAGYAGNEDLAAELLGFRPSRHVPAGAAGGAVLAAPAAGDEDDDEDDAE